MEYETEPFLTTGPVDARTHLLLAPGASASVRSAFLETLAGLLADRGLAVSRFEFAYMAARGAGTKRRPPPRAELLGPEYLSAVERLGAIVASGTRLLVGGKSMGGRVASLLADGLYAAGRVSGLVCIGYPFHPPDRPEELRTAHLAHLRCPTLIAQGERDPFGSRQEVASYALSPAIRFHWAADGDHDLAPRRGSGHTRVGNLVAAAEAIARFAASL